MKTQMFDKNTHTRDGMKELIVLFNAATGREKGHPERVAVMKDDSQHALYQKLVMALEESISKRPDLYFEWEQVEEYGPLLDFASSETTVLQDVPDKDAPEEEEEEETSETESEGEEPEEEEEETTEEEEEEEAPAPPPSKKGKKPQTTPKKKPTPPPVEEDDEPELSGEDKTDDSEEEYDPNAEGESETPEEEAPAPQSETPTVVDNVTSTVDLGPLVESLTSIVQDGIERILSDIRDLFTPKSKPTPVEAKKPIIAPPVKKMPEAKAADALRAEIDKRLKKGDLKDRTARVAFLKKAGVTVVNGISDSGLALKVRKVLTDTAAKK